MTKPACILDTIKQVMADATTTRPDASNQTRVLSTNAVTKQLGVTARTVRFYSEIGIVTPLRRGTTRLFTPDLVRRLKLARDLRSLGMDIKTVIQILDTIEKSEPVAEKLPALTEMFSEHSRDLLRQEEEIRQQYYATAKLAETLFNQCKPA
ncbi:MAG: MerR family transcriptional regulator [Oceanisphaera sp.]|nr:MerR family transcriptional regulator [Oceanisphaera sp.]